MFWRSKSKPSTPQAHSLTCVYMTMQYDHDWEFVVIVNRTICILVCVRVIATTATIIWSNCTYSRESASGLCAFFLVVVSGRVRKNFIRRRWKLLASRICRSDRQTAEMAISFVFYTDRCGQFTHAPAIKLERTIKGERKKKHAALGSCTPCLSFSKIVGNNRNSTCWNGNNFSVEITIILRMYSKCFKYRVFDSSGLNSRQNKKKILEIKSATQSELYYTLMLIY